MKANVTCRISNFSTESITWAQSISPIPSVPASFRSQRGQPNNQYTEHDTYATCSALILPNLVKSKESANYELSPGSPLVLEFETHNRHRPRRQLWPCEYLSPLGTFFCGVARSSLRPSDVYLSRFSTVDSHSTISLVELFILHTNLNRTLILWRRINPCLPQYTRKVPLSRSTHLIDNSNQTSPCPKRHDQQDGTHPKVPSRNAGQDPH